MIIYLDQNKWIDLAKAILKPQEHHKYTEVAEKIKVKVQEGEWIFPVSIIHIIETMSRANDNSRKNLASVIFSIAKNYSIGSRIDIEKYEFIELFSKQLNKEVPFEFKRIEQKQLHAISAERKFNVDFARTIISPSFDKKIKEIFEENINDELLKDEEFFDIFMENYYKGFIKEIIEGDKMSVKQWEEARKYLQKLLAENENKQVVAENKQVVYEKCLEETFRAKFIYYKSLLEKTLNATSEELLHNDIEKNIQFMESIPTLHVEINLMYALLKDPQREVQLHDNRDIAFLSVAIPYCDIVITEGTWVHLSTERNLAKRYSTRMSKDLNFLKEL